MLTNVFATGNIGFNYVSCEKESSGSGYVAGIARFSTSDGTAWEVIKKYHKFTGGDDKLAQYDQYFEGSSKRRRHNSGGGSTTLIPNTFCSDWESLANDQYFQSAQGYVFEKKYYNVAKKQADELGLDFAISRAELYDTAILHGVTTKNGLYDILGETKDYFIQDSNNSPSGSMITVNSYSVDELVWLNKFISVRSQYLKDQKIKASIDSYKYMLQNNEIKWDGENGQGSANDVMIYVLNDQGQKGDVNCANLFSDYPRLWTNSNEGDDNNGNDQSNGEGSGNGEGNGNVNDGGYGDINGKDCTSAGEDGYNGYNPLATCGGALAVAPEASIAIGLLALAALF